MQSRTTRRFWRLFADLPFEAQRDAKRAYRLFQSNPADPGLQFKKLEGEDKIYSVRIGLDYRALSGIWKKAALSFSPAAPVIHTSRRTQPPRCAPWKSRLTPFSKPPKWMASTMPTRCR